MTKPNLIDTVNAVNEYWHNLRGGPVEAINNADRCMYLSLCVMQRAGMLWTRLTYDEDAVFRAKLVAEAFISFGYRRMDKIDHGLTMRLWDLCCALDITHKLQSTGTAPSAKIDPDCTCGGFEDGWHSKDCAIRQPDFFTSWDNLKLLAQVAILNVSLNDMKLPDNATIENVQEAMAEGLCA